jgi:hypothetical protein
LSGALRQPFRHDPFATPDPRVRRDLCEAELMGAGGRIRR